jgi:TfoX/Sxy family transcriptional regulator of competence genes
MKWVKAPEELKSLIEALVKGVDCEKKLMFGYPAYFINKNMFAGLFQNSLFLRLSPDQVASLRKTFPMLSNLEPMPGRPIKNYYVIPPSLHSKSKDMQRLIEEAAAYCRSLPEKAKKPKRKS